MGPWQAIILGIVEGLTEYLPVSSTGHLLLTQRLLGIASSPASKAFAIAIQAGAIIAVLGLYRKRVAEMARGLVGKSRDGLRLVVHLAIAFIPAAVVGLLFDKTIEARLFGVPPVAGAWIVGGLLILIISRSPKAQPGHPGQLIERMTPLMALAIGCAQCLALWPGTSRSLVTILAAVLVGMTLEAAVEFSFLLGVLTLGAATSYEALKAGPVMLHAYGPLAIILGLGFAWISAVVAVRWMVTYLSRHDMRIFGWYRIALGVAVVAWLVAAH